MDLQKTNMNSMANTKKQVMMILGLEIVNRLEMKGKNKEKDLKMS